MYYACMYVFIAQLGPTLCNSMDISSPGSSLYRILQARILDWIPFPSPEEGFPGGSDGKESTCNAGYPGSIPGSGRSPGEGNGNLLEYSSLRNSMERGDQQAAVHGAAKESDTT